MEKYTKWLICGNKTELDSSFKDFIFAKLILNSLIYWFMDIYSTFVYTAYYVFDINPNEMYF